MELVGLFRPDAGLAVLSLEECGEGVDEEYAEGCWEVGGEG